MLSGLLLASSACRDSPVAPDGSDPRKSVGDGEVENCDGSAEGGYTCEGLVVVGEPPPEDDPGSCDINTGENCDNYPGSDGGGDGGGSGSDGGTTYDDSPPADDTQLDCHLAEIPCTLLAANDSQKTAMRTAIQKHVNQSRCPQLYDKAMSLVDNAQVWNETITYSGATYRGDYLREKDEMHIWTGNFQAPDKWLPWTLAHEAVHALQFVLGFTTHQEITSYGDSCLNFTI